MNFYPENCNHCSCLGGECSSPLVCSPLVCSPLVCSHLGAATLVQPPCVQPPWCSPLVCSPLGAGLLCAALLNAQCQVLPTPDYSLTHSHTLTHPLPLPCLKTSFHRHEGGNCGLQLNLIVADMIVKHEIHMPISCQTTMK